jgi:hypothetical protein
MRARGAEDAVKIIAGFSLRESAMGKVLLKGRAEALGKLFCRFDKWRTGFIEAR